MTKIAKSDGTRTRRGKLASDGNGIRRSIKSKRYIVFSLSPLLMEGVTVTLHLLFPRVTFWGNLWWGVNLSLLPLPVFYLIEKRGVSPSRKGDIRREILAVIIGGLVCLSPVLVFGFYGHPLITTWVTRCYLAWLALYLNQVWWTSVFDPVWWP